MAEESHVEKDRHVRHYAARNHLGMTLNFAVLGEPAEHGDVDGFAFAIASKFLDLHNNPLPSLPALFKSVHARHGAFAISCKGPPEGVTRMPIAIHETSDIRKPYGAIGSIDIGREHWADLILSHGGPQPGKDVAGERLELAIATVALMADHPPSMAVDTAILSRMISKDMKPLDPWNTPPDQSEMDTKLLETGILAAVGDQPGKRMGPMAPFIKSKCDRRLLRKADEFVEAFVETGCSLDTFVRAFSDQEDLADWGFKLPSAHERLIAQGAAETLLPFIDACKAEAERSRAPSCVEMIQKEINRRIRNHARRRGQEPWA